MNESFELETDTVGTYHMRFYRCLSSQQKVCGQFNENQRFSMKEFQGDLEINENVFGIICST